MEYKYLDKINSPSDVKALSQNEVPQLCEEIRAFLVENVERTGGHLSSNLGVTELSVAIHRVFDSPKDHIIFDVGHQSYVHKIITGRKDRFKTLRKTGGLSGFTSIKESAHDAFGAGHSSTSVSAAIGYTEADRISGSDAYTVAVMGDGAFTGGMAHEALNNCDPDRKLIIILNENGMSISVNKGRFASYLSKVRKSKGYRGWKRATNAIFAKVPLIGKPILRSLTFIKKKIKNLIFSSNYFEALGLYYIGPIDGNNYKKTEDALRSAKELGKCVIVHLKTKKGKGYLPAEENPDNFHSVYTGNDGKSQSFHKIFAEKLCNMAKDDEKITAITAAMGMGTGLDIFGTEFPDRYFDVGIAEEHALTFAAGLAKNGMKPYVALYSTFLQRAYDSLIHDIALQNLPVRLIIDRASLAVSDGATHHGIFDVAFISHIPNFTLYAPVTNGSLRTVLDISRDINSPIAIRYPNLSECQAVKQRFYPDGDYTDISVRTDFALGECKYVFITYGSIVSRVISAADILKSRGIDAGIILLEKLKPWDDVAKILKNQLSGAVRILFVEEGIKCGGAGMAIREALAGVGFDFSGAVYEIAAIDDNFASPDAECELYDFVGLSPEKLASHFIFD